MSESTIDLTGLTIAVLGGTGPQGRGLARRFAQAGLNVVLGSRTTETGEAAAKEPSEAIGKSVAGADNAGASEQGHILPVLLPWDGHGAPLTSLPPTPSG